MKENEEEGYNGGGLKGPLYWLAGVATAVAAKAVSGPGGVLGGVFGNPPPPVDGPGAPVSQRILDLTTENTQLKANAHADRLNAEQLVWNARQQGHIDCLQRQVDQLYTLTRLMVPAANIVPPVVVSAGTTTPTQQQNGGGQ